MAFLPVDSSLGSFDSRCATPAPASRTLPYGCLLLTEPLHDPEHVLRAASHNSEPTIRRPNRRSSSIVTNPYDGASNEDYVYRPKIHHNKPGKTSKYSPTASIKRGKAERLLKEHGSPPGVRVTAGGRIVPDGLTPLNSPRFDQNNAPRFQSTNRLPRNYAYTVPPKTLNGYVIDSGNGTLAQIIDGVARQVETHNGVLQLYMPAPNLPIQPPVATIPSILNAMPVGSQSASLPIAQTLLQPSSAPAISNMVSTVSAMPSPREIHVMEEVHAKLEQDLKDLDRNEVLQRESLTAANRNDIAKRRVELVNRIDQSRRGLIEAKRLLTNTNAETGNESRAATQQYGHDQGGAADRGASSGPVFYHEVLQQYQPLALEQSVTNQQFGLPPLQYPLSMQALTAFMPQDLTSLHYAKPQELEQFPELNPLRERAENVGLGLSASQTNIKGYAENIPMNTKESSATGMNLDGNAHQPRRSHAVEIRRPNEQPGKAKSALDPTSPTYLPKTMSLMNAGNRNEDADSNTFLPSPRLVKEMEDLVQSPESEICMLSQARNEPAVHHPSDSSVGTEDFFPHEAHRHSNTKYSYEHRDGHVNLPAWMVRPDEPVAPEPTTTPARPPNKFVWNDSPDQFQLSNPPTSSERRIPSGGSVARRPRDLDLSPFPRISPGASARQSIYPCEPTGPNVSNQSPHPRSSPVSFLLERATAKAAMREGLSPKKTEDYWAGFRTGSKQDVMSECTNEDFRRGYRDGLIQSLNPFGPPHTAPLVQRPYDEGPTPAEALGRASSSSHVRVPSLSRTASLPSFQPPSVPANSLVNTPTRPGRSPLNASSGANEFIEAGEATHAITPNSNAKRSVPEREIGTQTSHALLRGPEPPSPLATRYGANQATVGETARQSSLAGKLCRGNPYDQQRFYQKGKSSVAQSTTQAQGWFPQLDGSAEDEEPSAEASADVSTPPSSPRGKRTEKPKGQASPGKTRTSAAMDKIGGLLSGSSKKAIQKEPDTLKVTAGDDEQDPTKMTTPQKKEWRNMWRSRFEALKEQERKEIEQYKKQNPLPSKIG